MTAAPRKRPGYRCSGGCGKVLHLDDFQVIHADGRSFCLDCAPGDDAQPVKPAALLDGVCPECGGILREWERGSFLCVGRDDDRGGCGWNRMVGR